MFPRGLCCNTQLEAIVLQESWHDSNTNFFWTLDWIILLSTVGMLYSILMRWRFQKGNEAVWGKGFPISRTCRLRHSGLPSTTSFPQIRECHVDFHVSLPYPVNVATDCGPREPCLASVTHWHALTLFFCGSCPTKSHATPNPNPHQTSSSHHSSHHPLFSISNALSQLNRRIGIRAAWWIWQPFGDLNSATGFLKGFGTILQSPNQEFQLTYPHFSVPDCGFGKHRAYGDSSPFNFRVRWRGGRFPSPKLSPRSR